MAVPPGVVTATLTAPATPEGLVAVICVALLTVKLAAVPPNETEVALVRFVPVMTTDVPPFVVPDEGLMDVIVGAAT